MDITRSILSFHTVVLGCKYINALSGVKNMVWRSIKGSSANPFMSKMISKFPPSYQQKKDNMINWVRKYAYLTSAWIGSFASVVNAKSGIWLTIISNVATTHLDSVPFSRILQIQNECESILLKDQDGLFWGFILNLRVQVPLSRADIPSNCIPNWFKPVPSRL